MKGYAYMDLDGDLVYKTSQYIDGINPGFFAQNRHLIARHWSFDTEVISTMLKMFREIQDLKVSTPAVQLFVKSLNFDMSTLKNADKV